MFMLNFPLPYLAYTGQVCAADHKVLSINQGVEFLPRPS